MTVLTITTVCVHNDAKRPKHIRKRQYIPNKSNDELDNVELYQLRQQVSKYKRQQAKLKKLAEWNLRSTKSSLKDVQETLEILEDLYGDQMYEEDL